MARMSGDTVRWLNPTSSEMHRQGSDVDVSRATPTCILNSTRDKGEVFRWDLSGHLAHLLDDSKNLTGAAARTHRDT